MMGTRIPLPGSAAHLACAGCQCSQCCTASPCMSLLLALSMFKLFLSPLRWRCWPVSCFASVACPSCVHVHAAASLLSPLEDTSAAVCTRVLLAHRVTARSLLQDAPAAPDESAEVPRAPPRAPTSSDGTSEGAQEAQEQHGPHLTVTAQAAAAAATIRSSTAAERLLAGNSIGAAGQLRTTATALQEVCSQTMVMWGVCRRSRLNL